MNIGFVLYPCHNEKVEMWERKKYVSIPILWHEKVAKVISIQILFQAGHEIRIRIE